MNERIRIWWQRRRQAAKDLRNIRKFSYPVRVISESPGPTPVRFWRLNEVGEPVGEPFATTFKDGVKWITPANGTVQNPNDPSPRSRITSHGR